MRHHRVPLIRAALGLVLAALVLVAPARADTLPPVLQSVVRDAGQLVAGNTLRLRTTATDATGLGGVMIGYRSPTGHDLAARPVAGEPGLTELEITPTLPNGTYVLTWVSVWDSTAAQNQATYLPDGRVESASPGAPTTHSVNLSGLNFTVSGNTAVDQDPPVLLSATRTIADARAGDTQRVRVTVADATGLAGSAVGFRGPDGNDLSVHADPGQPAILDLPITAALPDGVYALNWISVWDAALLTNAASYLRDGRITSNLTTAPPTHALDLTVLDFTLRGNEFRTAASVALTGPGNAVEVEIMPLIPAEGLAHVVTLSTTFGTLAAGTQSGSQITVPPAGAGRFVARLTGDRPGLATLSLDIDGRALPAATVRFVSTPVATATTVSGPAEGRVGQPVALAATVTAQGAVPAGRVSFRRGGVEFATAALNASGRAGVSATLPLGPQQITAHYLGAAGFAPSASAAQRVAILPERLTEFRGGGAVFALTGACLHAGWGAGPHPIRLQYGPGEANGMPSQVALLWPDGSEHFQVWQPLTQTEASFDTLGRQIWSLFVLHGLNPRVTPMQRRITRPDGVNDITRAAEVMLRLRIANFAGIPGCGATVAGVLTRAD